MYQMQEIGSTTMAPKRTMETRKIVSMPTDLIERISEWRHEQRISSESEAIRRLIDMGLQSVGK